VHSKIIVKKQIANKKFITIVGAGALLLGVLSGCALQPRHDAAVAAADPVPVAAADAGPSDELPDPFGWAAGDGGQALQDTSSADIATRAGAGSGAIDTGGDVVVTDPAATTPDSLAVADANAVASDPSSATGSAAASSSPGGVPGPRIKQSSGPGLREPAAILPDLMEPLPGTDALAGEAGPDAPLIERDLWERIRSGFALTANNPRIQTAAAWYLRHPRFVVRATEQAEPYLHYIVSEVERRGMPSELALLPLVESAFEPFAYSAGRAAGLWQFIPDTGRRFGLKLNWWYDGRRDVMASTQAALEYLQYLHDTFDGDWLLALAAYNSGEGTVQRAVRENQRKNKPTDYWSLPLPRETQEYVPRLLAISAIIADPGQQGITLKSIPDTSYISTVEIDTQLDLAVAAKLADMSLADLHRLNPAFNRWATDPDGPHLLLLPAEKAAAFSAALAELPADQRVRWLRHRVRAGETLNTVAARYHATPAVLRRLNKLSGNTVRAGQHLLVPVASDTAIDLPAQGVEIPAEQIHTVVAGDSLSRLAKRHRVTTKQLAAWNGLDSRAELRLGQKLVVRAPTADKAIVPKATSGPLNPKRKIVYTVRKGDSLALISKRYDVSVKELKHWNDIKKKAPRLKAGQRITVYVDVTADAG